jgi:hypothetical protein
MKSQANAQDGIQRAPTTLQTFHWGMIGFGEYMRRTWPAIRSSERMSKALLRSKAAMEGTILRSKR